MMTEFHGEGKIAVYLTARTSLCIAWLRDYNNR